MTVQLPPDLMRMIEAHLASGSFATAEDVLRAALLQLDSVEQFADSLNEEWLRAAIQDGLASGDPITVDLDNLRNHLLNGVPLRPL